MLNKWAYSHCLPGEIGKVRVDVFTCTYFAILFVLVKYDNSKHFKLQVLRLFPLLENSIQSLRFELAFFFFFSQIELEDKRLVCEKDNRQVRLFVMI